MSETAQSTFEGWAIVEMMGHQQEIGFVTTQAFGQAVLFRVDQPELPEREILLKRPEYMEIDGEYKTWPAGAKVKRQLVPARSRLVAPGSLYALNPCTEEAARAALEKNMPRKLALVEMPPIAALPAITEADEDDDDEFEDRCSECNRSTEVCDCPL